jgi:hypothetical protein
MNRRRVLAATLALACASAQSHEGRQPGEYLITLVADADEKAIRDVYGHLGVKAIKTVSKDVYLLTVVEDPGPAAMESLRRGSKVIRAVQPNYRYRTR